MSVTENLRIESESRHAKVLMLMPRGHDPERDSQAAGSAAVHREQGPEEALARPT